MTLISVAPQSPIVSFVDASHSVTDYVRFGLYDGAFDPPSVLLNNDGDETKNFVGSDSRRFFVRVVDMSTMSTSATKRRQTKMVWQTYEDDRKTVHDHGGADPTITLVETAAGSGIFESPWLMLVSDPWETQKVKTTTGIAGLGEVAYGSGDYRLRLASMFGHIAVEYPAGSGDRTFCQLFRRGVADERRNVPVQLFILESLYKKYPLLPDYVLGPDLESARRVYARMGMWVWSVVDPVQAKTFKKVTVGKESLLIIPVPAGVNPDNVTNDQRDLIAGPIPGLLASGASGTTGPYGKMALTDTIRAVYVGGCVDGQGVACRDMDHMARACRGMVLVADAQGKIGSDMGSSLAHEICHMLTDAAHYVDPPIVGRYHGASNLMGGGGTGVGSPQRLWDAPNANYLNQSETMRKSHYIRG
ncbi:MAG: hypothetical protein IPJ34_24205 [Myxococcales bacterium]|nr:hypothetical protein [Myxococcales bacterium]